MSEAILKKNKVGETLILIGIVLHILNLVLVLTGVWGEMSNVVLILFVMATIPFIVGYIYIKKEKAAALWGYLFIPISLFFTHYIASLFFIIGSLVTITVARKNRRIQQNSQK